jgi:hypothetical protein
VLCRLLDILTIEDVDAGKYYSISQLIYFTTEEDLENDHYIAKSALSKLKTPVPVDSADC